MSKEATIFNKNWADAQVLELSYTNNDIVKLKIKNYQDDIFVYEFKNVFKLYFEDYINEDISDIKYNFYSKDNENICDILIFSAWSNQEIIKFSFFVE